MAGIERYMENITPQHRGAPRFREWLKANLSRAAEADDAAQRIREAFRIEAAVGEQLRKLLQTVGIASGIEGYDDEVLRRLLMAKIVKNQWDGCLGSIGEVWRTVFGNEFLLEYADHQNMEVVLGLTGDRPTEFLKVMLFREAMPKPAGVALTVRLRTKVDAKVRLVACAAVVHSYLAVVV